MRTCRLKDSAHRSRTDTYHLHTRELMPCGLLPLQEPGTQDTLAGGVTESMAAGRAAEENKTA